jgi:hypothetical protein
MEGFSQFTPFILLLVVVYFIYTLLKADKKNKSTTDDKIKSLSEIYSKDNESNLNSSKTDNDMKRDIQRVANNSKIIVNILIFYLICSLIGVIYLLTL